MLSGSRLISDVPPVEMNGRTLVPLRAVSETLGAQILWDSNSKVVTATLGNTTVKVPIGSNIIYKNNEAVTIDVCAKIINDHTFVPIRAISEAFGCNISWNGENRTIGINMDI